VKSRKGEEQRNVKEKRKIQINAVMGKNKHKRKTIPLSLECRKARAFGGKKNARVARFQRKEE